LSSTCFLKRHFHEDFEAVKRCPASLPYEMVKEVEYNHQEESNNNEGSAMERPGKIMA
jgi:hypothetical protein